MLECLFQQNDQAPISIPASSDFEQQLSLKNSNKSVENRAVKEISLKSVQSVLNASSRSN